MNRMGFFIRSVGINREIVALLRNMNENSNNNEINKHVSLTCRRLAIVRMQRLNHSVAAHLQNMYLYYIIANETMKCYWSTW